MTMLPDQTRILLNTGASIPAVGFGTFQAKPKEVQQAVYTALKGGYRHIDCASIYGNETEVGHGLKESGMNREDVFITSKLWNNKHKPEDVEAALDATLKDLGTDYVDLYLIHWPVAFKAGDETMPLTKEGRFILEDIPLKDTWAAMERLLSTGKTKAIGVSNFNIRRLEDLLSVCKTVPAVNQIEAHPYLQQRELLDYCRSKGIVVQAYSPLGNNEINAPRVIDDPYVQQLASEEGLDAGQMLVSWAVGRGTVVLPKSVTSARILSNIKVRLLTAKTFQAINSLERHRRNNYPGRWGYNVFDELTQVEVDDIAQSYAADNLKVFAKAENHAS